jgi:hypothetical protein
VVVRDWGSGIPSHSRTAHGTGPGIGLPVIGALVHRLELRCPPDGGTEVWMAFPPRGGDGAPQPLVGQEPALPADAHAAQATTQAAHAAHDPTIALTVVPGRLARTILPRLMAGLAARAHFSTDRLSDVHLLADALGAADAPCLRIAAAIEPRALELRIGPLESGRAQQLIAASSLDGLGPVIAKLVDRQHIERAGSHEVLALRLSDRRRAPDAGSAAR